MTATEDGPEKLHDLLKKVDPVSAEKIHGHNTKRVIRALEYFHQKIRIFPSTTSRSAGRITL